MAVQGTRHSYEQHLAMAQFAAEFVRQTGEASPGSSTPTTNGALSPTTEDQEVPPGRPRAYSIPRPSTGQASPPPLQQHRIIAPIPVDGSLMERTNSSARPVLGTIKEEV